MYIMYVLTLHILKGTLSIPYFKHYSVQYIFIFFVNSLGFHRLKFC